MGNQRLWRHSVEADEVRSEQTLQWRWKRRVRLDSASSWREKRATLAHSDQREACARRISVAAVVCDDRFAASTRKPITNHLAYLLHRTRKYSFCLTTLDLQLLFLLLTERVFVFGICVGFSSLDFVSVYFQWKYRFIWSDVAAGVCLTGRPRSRF